MSLIKNALINLKGIPHLFIYAVFKLLHICFCSELILRNTQLSVASWKFLLQATQPLFSFSVYVDADICKLNVHV